MSGVDRFMIRGRRLRRPSFHMLGGFVHGFHISYYNSLVIIHTTLPFHVVFFFLYRNQADVKLQRSHWSFTM